MKNHSENQEIRSPHILMRRFLVSFIVFVTVLSVTRVGLAYSNAYTQLQAEKQLLVDGDMEAGGVASWNIIDIAATAAKVDNAKSGRQAIRFTKNIFTSAKYGQVVGGGKRVKVTGWARGTGTPKVWTGTSVEFVVASAGATQWQYFTVIGTITGDSTLYIGGLISASGNYVEFDDVFVTVYRGSTSDREKNLLVDGDMEESGTGGWNAINSTLSKQSSNPKSGKNSLRVTYLSSATGYATKNVLTVGKKFRITGWARGDGTANPFINAGGGVLAFTGTSSAEWQKIDVVKTAAGDSTLQLRGNNLSAGLYVEFDDIVATEYVGSTKDIEKQLIADGDMEASGTGSWVAVGSPVLTKVTDNAKSGRQSLRIAWNGVINPYARQGILVTGKRYRATGWIRGDGSKNPCVMIGTAAGCAFTGTASTVWQHFDVTQVANSTLFAILLTGNSAGYIEADDINVTALP